MLMTCGIMEDMKPFLTRFITALENTPLSLGSFVLAFTALIITRLLIENTLGLFQAHSLFFMFFEFTHTFLFFLCSFILMLPVVRLAGAADIKKAANVLLFGFLIILTPPLIDRAIFGSGNYWSFYEFDGFFGLLQRFVTLFGDTPDIGITYGVRVEVVVVTLALALYTYAKSQRWLKTLLIALLAYTVLFVLGTFPSWLTLGILLFQKSFLAINANDVAALFLSPEAILARDLTDFRGVLNFKMSLVYGALGTVLTGILLWKESPRAFFALFRNARFPQLIYHAGLFLLGLLFALHFSRANFEGEFFHLAGIVVLLIAIECAWLASVIANDIYDTAIDVQTNPTRPLIEQTISLPLYRIYGILFFVTSLLLAGIINFSALFLLLAYQALAWLYSAPPLRLKRFPLIATLLAASAGLVVLIIGYLAVSTEGNLKSLPLPLLVFLFVSYTLSLPLKDFKDRVGDQANHVLTLPVLLGENGAKQMMGSLIFLLAMASPIVLNIRSLFWVALLYGGLAFWTIQKGTPNEASFFSFRKLPGIILSLTILYGIAIFLAAR